MGYFQFSLLVLLFDMYNEIRHVAEPRILFVSYQKFAVITKNTEYLV